MRLATTLHLLAMTMWRQFTRPRSADPLRRCNVLFNDDSQAMHADETLAAVIKPGNCGIRFTSRRTSGERPANRADPCASKDFKAAAGKDRAARRDQERSDLQSLRGEPLPLAPGSFRSACRSSDVARRYQVVKEVRERFV